MIHIETVSPEIAESLCRSMTADLPEYFGLPEANEHYAVGVRTRMNLAAKVEGEYRGLVSIEFPYPNNSNIYWMAVLRASQGQGIGRRLMEVACHHASAHGATTMTVETLAPLELDANYLHTYHFYQSAGFAPMFHLKPIVYTWNMVYMVKSLQPAEEARPRPHMTDIDLLTHHINEETAAYGKASPFVLCRRDDAGQMIAGVNGCCLYGTVYTDQLWVDPAHRKKGLARNLMERVHALGRSSDCSMATVQTMSFQGAVSFYEALGYKQDFERKGYVRGSHCIFMRKDL